MTKATVGFGRRAGRIKPMHAVNNGPIAPTVRGTSNFELYKAAGIPYARNHDASFYSAFGGEHTVDVHRIFKNFNADENDPESYIFAPTDKYLKDITNAGTKVFYRLGASIEHDFKYGTYPPASFEKWAKICEHIISHYNEGWAEGFNYNIEYWEIWNEPDCKNADGSNPCWQGTEEQFIEFYSVAAKYLKKRFPNIKIGGPAFMSPWRSDFQRNFLMAVKNNGIPLDFYSFHRYDNTPDGIYETVYEAKASLKEAGLENVETVLNEWNYVKGWMGEDWKESLNVWKGLKGASFITATMYECQYSPLDMLMFYDARPCSMCSLFEPDRPWVALKGYYPFKMFSELYKIGEAVEIIKNDKSIYAAAAKNNNSAKIMLTFFENSIEEQNKEVILDLKSLGLSGDINYKCCLLDENSDCVTVKQMVLGKAEKLKLNISLYSCCLLSFEKNRI